MQEIQYPAMTEERRSLTEILSIQSHNDYDTIYLGSIADGNLLGYIEYRTGVFIFYPQSEMTHPFPNRTTYYGALFDSLVYVVNDLELSIDLCILTNRKVNKESK